MATYLSLQKAAHGTPYSKDYLSLRIRQGKLQAVKMNGKWFTTQGWLNEYYKRVEEFHEKRSSLKEYEHEPQETHEIKERFQQQGRAHAIPGSQRNRFGSILRQYASAGVSYVVLPLVIGGVVAGLSIHVATSERSMQEIVEEPHMVAREFGEVLLWQAEQYTTIASFASLLDAANSTVQRFNKNLAEALFLPTPELRLVIPTPPPTPPPTLTEPSPPTRSDQRVGAPIQNIERITQIEPIREITKEVRTEVRTIDSDSISTLNTLRSDVATVLAWRSDIENLQSITTKLQATPPSSSPSAPQAYPVYIGNTGLQVGGNGNFSSLGVTGAAGIGNLGVGQSATFGKTSSDQFTVNSTSTFAAPVTISSSLSITGNLITTSAESLTIPVGTTAERPASVANGMLRYNTTNAAFEGYGNSVWGGLGGVIDIDKDTKIIAELSESSDEDTLYFYAGDATTGNHIATVTSSGFTVVAGKTSTFAGQGLFTRAPTSAHTGTWATGSSTWNQDDASIYINPASATGDANLIAAAVAGSVKFSVDAEGDIYGKNLILEGTTTSGTTSIAGDLTVEGNTTLGDAPTDTLTFNASTLAIPNNLNIDSNTLFIDASNNRIGIGTATPSGLFNIIDSGGDQFLFRDNGTLYSRSVAPAGSTDTPVEINAIGGSTAPSSGSLFYLEAVSNAVDASPIGFSLFTKVQQNTTLQTGAKFDVRTGQSNDNNITVTTQVGLDLNTIHRAANTVTNQYGIDLSTQETQSGDVTNSYGLYISEIANATNLAYSIYSADTAQSYFAGNVGIGTASPQSLLDVQGAEAAPGLLTLATKGTTTVDGDVLGRINFNAPLDAAGDDAILAGAAIWAEADDTFSATVNSTELVFATNTSAAATERMRIDSAGNVGIGTATPASVLHIGNTDYADASDGLTFGDGDSGIFESADDTLNIHVGGSTDDIKLISTDDILLLWSATNNARLSVKGRDIAGDIPTVYVENDDPDTQGFILEGPAAPVADYLQVRSSGASTGDIFVVDSSGNVGINTTAPQSLLDVQSGAGSTGGILTLANQELTVVDGDVLGRINFNAPLESDGSDAILAGAAIWAEADDTFSATVNSTELVFATNTSAAATENRQRWQCGDRDGKSRPIGAY
jgi:hypothetical protein